MKNILIVEDEVLVAKQIEKTLIDNSYNSAGIAIDYTSAIELLETNPVDFVLLDVNINGEKSGIDIANYINQNLAIPFLFMTSYNDNDTLIKLKLVNPIAYLYKPINELTLLTNIDIYFNSKNKKKKEIIAIKAGAKIYNINISELMYVKSEHVYLNFYFMNRSKSIRLSFSAFLEQIPDKMMFKISRSIAVNPNFLDEIGKSTLKIQEKSFKISDSYKEKISDIL